MDSSLTLRSLYWSALEPNSHCLGDPVRFGYIGVYNKNLNTNYRKEKKFFIDGPLRADGGGARVMVSGTERSSASRLVGGTRGSGAGRGGAGGAYLYYSSHHFPWASE